jgi:hypothetical protein
LVPLTAGACSPRRRSSRRVSRQTSGPDPSPHDRSGAASRRHRAPHPNLAPTPLPDGRSLGSLGEAALGCVRIGSEPIWPTARARPQVSSGAVDPSIEPSSAWPTATAVPLNARYGQPCPTGWWADVSRKGEQRRPGSGSGHAPQVLIWRGQDRRERLFWVVCGHRSWLPSSGPAAGRAEVKGPSPRPFRHGGIPYGSTS